VLDSMNETMSISTGLYPNLDLWNANKLYYIALRSEQLNMNKNVAYVEVLTCAHVTENSMSEY